MKIELNEIKIEDIVKDYKDDAEEGVTGYGGNLDIRPKYQREFVYADKQREAVIQSVRKNFPLNSMYWMVTDDGKYEVIDGQQRTISICQYVNDVFTINYDGEPRTFSNLEEDEKRQILDYRLQIYLCTGEASERLDWFRTINIAGEKLTDQEIRNAIYSGTWVEAAKKYFSKTGCPAYKIGSNYVNGACIRQEYLETAIRWKALSEDEKMSIDQYMSAHQHDPTATDLFNHFSSVINWVQGIFPKYNKAMKGIDWGYYHKHFKDAKLDPKVLQTEIDRLQDDDDVQSQKGIYEYVLDKNEKHLNLRTFSDKEKNKKFKEQDGICQICKNKFNYDEMEGDHIIPWAKGGKTIYSNLQMLCKKCNRTKSGS